MSAMEKKTGEKKNFFAPIKNYFKEVRGELRKVVFPTFKQVRKNTTVVIVVVIIVGLIISGLDFIFNNGRNYLINYEDNKINSFQQQTTEEPIDVTQGQDETNDQQESIDQQQVPAEEGSNQ